MNETHDACCPRPDSGAVGGAFDLAVVGAGSAGFSAAITVADEGGRVALIGHGTIGGTCVNIGCVPSKTLIRAAETLYHARSAERFGGIGAAARLTDWSAVMADKRTLVETLRQAKYADLLASYPTLTYMPGRARLAAGGVEVDGHGLVRAAKTIIATGSSPAIPPIDGIDGVAYLTSESALEIDHLPQSLIVIGGGVIGVELGQMFARFGSHVTIVCRSRLLPSGEPEVGEALEAALGAEGIEIVRGVSYRSIARSDGAIHLEVEQQSRVRRLEGEEVLVATGRRPNTDGLGLAEQGIERGANGGILVDDQMRTSRAGVYAAGDVTGRDMFVYMAAHGARVAALDALGDGSLSYDRLAMPEVVFTDPQVATVGLTEARARAAGIEVRTSLLGLEHVPRALAARDTRGLIKLVAEAAGKRLIGAHIIAPEGADTVQTAAIAIRAGLTVDQLGAMIFPYLTTVEGLKLAAQTFDKDVAKLSCCAG